MVEAVSGWPRSIVVSVERVSSPEASRHSGHIPNGASSGIGLPQSGQWVSVGSIGVSGEAFASLCAAHGGESTFVAE